MQAADDRSQGTQPPTLPTSSAGHPLPRRTSPAKSVTLRHHRLARDASLRASPGNSLVATNTEATSRRRISSGDSHDTCQSDPNKWFDHSNQNPMATFDTNAIDADPPFFQKESDSSNDDKAYMYPHQTAPAQAAAEQSSSADDYRSVIDDLTVEIQKLKDELKRYKQTGPDMLRKEKLFEIKIHGLPKKKRRELETTLREFTSGLESSPDASSSRRKKSSRQTTRDHQYSGSGSMSKHASSSSGSNIRPVDSAYASMSTGANSSGTSLGRPPPTSWAKSEQKVENYLRDIPEGLYPRNFALTDKDKKKLVVRRLEQLFTGKISARAARAGPTVPPAGQDLTVLTAGIQAQQQPQSTRSAIHVPPSLGVSEPAREAKMLPAEQHSSRPGNKSTSRGNGSASNSNVDQTESGGHGSSGFGTNTSPSMSTLPEQRPTRPKDLDPDRVQIPSENMEYIRHLGLVPPGLLSEPPSNGPDVLPDADGWVYLNLLCNLAQLHIINVTPDFVRVAVSEMSAKFQLSPDGRKIRWRGGSDGTRFSSDGSGDNSQASPQTDDTDGSNKDDQRKKRKVSLQKGDENQSGGSSKHASKSEPQVSASSESFHYKPLFVRQDSSYEQTSLDDTMSSYGPVDDSNVGSRWDQSGSGASNRRKRRRDGAIIYYSGAPFCTDLSGDPGDISSTTYMLSSERDAQVSSTQFVRPPPRRTDSGSSLAYRPLSDPIDFGSRMDVDDHPPGLAGDTGDDAIEVELEPGEPDDRQYMEVHPLEPCGLGGVLPEDHFMVVVTTKRPKHQPVPPASPAESRAAEITETIISRLVTMATASLPPSKRRSPVVEMEYVSGRIKRLAPVPLPPPAIFFPPFSPDSSSAITEDSDSDESSDDLKSELMSRRANPHQSDGYPDGVDLSSGDEDGEDPDDESNPRPMYERNVSTEQILPERSRRSQQPSFSSADAALGTPSGRSKSASVEIAARADRSPAAAAGRVESGYMSSDEAS